MRFAVRLLSLPLLAALALAQGAGAPPAATPVASAQDNELRERAFGAENRGRYGEAAEAFLELGRRDPGRAEWVVAAGRCLGRAGRFRDAIDLLDQGRKQFPGVVDIPAMLARTLLLKSEADPGAMLPRQLWLDAAELAEGVLQLDPNHEDCRLLLAQARYLLGEWEEAIRQADLAVTQHPHRPGAHILRGRIAFDFCRELLKVHAQGGLEGEALANLVGRIDTQRQQAKAAFTKAAGLDGNRAHPHVMLAQLALLDQRTAEARGHSLDALAIDPDAPVDHTLFERELDSAARGEAYTAALTRYEARADARPEKAATLRFFAGRASYDAGNWQAARSSLERALADHPAASNAHYYAALAAYQLGDHDGAERHAAAYAAVDALVFADVIRSLAAEPRGQVAAIVQFLADRAYQQGRIDSSRDLNHVMAHLLDSADAWNNHALLCRESKRFPEAVTAYGRALEKEPESPQLLNDLAVVLHHHVPNPENLARARAMYEKAIQLADQQLADQRLGAAERARTSKARDDARANLAELPK